MTAWRATVVVLSLGVLAASSSSAAQGVAAEAQGPARLSLSSGQFDRIGTQAGQIGVLPVQKAITGFNPPSWPEGGVPFMVGGDDGARFSKPQPPFMAGGAGVPLMVGRDDDAGGPRM